MSARKVLGVSMDLDMTDTHWLLSITPGRALEARGIHPYQAKVLICTCKPREGRKAPILHHKGTRNQYGCGGFTTLGIAQYVGRLLRSYPKVPAREAVAA